ncbi:MAG: omega-3 fatty acid desaturase [Polyangiaceae bacterium]|nr:omega-3 fatty acid desaturase [Polyangiaceae bacterium]
MAAMDDVPREILQAAYKRNPKYIWKVPFHFSLLAACGVLLYAVSDMSWAVKIPVGLVCTFFVTNIIRGLGAIAHDSVHGTVFKSKRASYWLGAICWAPSGMSYTVYSNYHLHHHRITNTYPDVDNFVVTDYTKNPFLAKALLLAVYTFAYPLYFMTQIVRYVPRLTAWQKIRMNLELVAWWAVVAAGVWFLPAYVMLFLYGLPFVFGSILASTTSMIEHFEMEPGEDAYSSRTYATDAHFMNFLWNNVSFHNEHHKYPGIPWYNLRSFHEAAYPHYDQRVQAECYKTFLPVVWMLWKRCLQIDVTKIEAKYSTLNREEERKRHMELAGIAPANAS